MARIREIREIRGQISVQEMMIIRFPNRGAFAVRELGVVLLVIAGLLLVGIPWLLSRREESRRLACEKHLIDLSDAARAFDSQFGKLPGYVQEATGPMGDLPHGQSWAQTLVPLLVDAPGSVLPEGKNLADRNAWPLLPQLTCPAYQPASAEAGRGWLGYVANTGLPDATTSAAFPADWPANGALVDTYHKPRPRDVVATLAAIEAGDGAQFTLLFSENLDAGYLTDTAEAQIGFVWLARMEQGVPNPGRELYRINAERGMGDGSLRYARPSSWHGHGVNTAFASGRTQFLREGLDYLVYCQLMSSNGAHVKEPGSDKPLPAPFRTRAVEPADREDETISK